MRRATLAESARYTELNRALVGALEATIEAVDDPEIGPEPQNDLYLEDDTLARYERALALVSALRRTLGCPPLNK